MPDVDRRCRETEFAVFLNGSYQVYCCSLGLGSKKVNCRYLTKEEINGVILDICLKCYIGNLEEGLQKSILQAS